MLATLTSTCLPIDTAKFRPITLFLRGVLQGIGRRISHRFDHTAGISHGNRAVGNVLNDHRTGPNRAAMTDGYARKDGPLPPIHTSFPMVMGQAHSIPLRRSTGSVG